MEGDNGSEASSQGSEEVGRFMVDFNSGHEAGNRETWDGSELPDGYLSSFRGVVGLGEEDIMRMEWGSPEGAYEFYRAYAKCNGFGVRKGDSRRDVTGELVRYRFFCNRAGVREKRHLERVDRKRAHRSETRTNCEAKLSIYLDRDEEVWRVRKVVLSHNHDLTPLSMVHMIPSHRGIGDGAKANIKGMHGEGVATSKIVGYMAGMAGDYGNLGFSKKDTYNFVDRERRASIADGDANAMIVYLEGQAGADPMAEARFTLTHSGTLGNLFWADGPSRVDYQHFRDVVAFDSTYKKNKYKRPLVIFCGVNNHKQTCVFGFGILEDERAESYKWLLENMLDVMCDKKPNVVVTDGDKAMIEAIKEVLPEATHRLCAWHIEKNVTTNAKVSELRSLFNRWLYADMCVEEFEAQWAVAFEDFGLCDSMWASQMYEKRHMWANAYLRDKFCAGFRTTSRCEGINSYVKKLTSSRSTLVELVQDLGMLLREYRNNELAAQFNSINGFPVLTTCLQEIECSAAKVYTREVFQDVRKQIELVGALNFIGKNKYSTAMVYDLEEYRAAGVVCRTAYDRSCSKIDCQCYHWKRHGYPCCHMFFVMRHEHVIEIPHRLILRRWCIDAKAVGNYGERNDGDDRRLAVMRQGALHVAAQWVSHIGAQTDALFRKAMVGLTNLSREMEAMRRGRNDLGLDDGVDRPNVLDPEVAKTKGVPRQGKKGVKRRRCKRCFGTGHNKRSCPKGKDPRGKKSKHGLSNEVLNDEGCVQLPNCE